MRSPRQHHDHEAEAAVLGGILLRNEVLSRLDALEASDFHHPRNRIAWGAVLALASRNEPIDAVAVVAEVARQGHSGAFGGGGDDAPLGHIATLLTRVPSPDNVVHYAGIVMRLSVTHRLRLALAESLAALDDETNADELDGEGAVQWVQARISKIDTKSRPSSVSIAEAVKRRCTVLERIAEERATGQRTLTGYATGVERLDREIGGYQAGVVSILGARPGMGKSSLGMSCADANSAANIGVHAFTLEDTIATYADRAMSRTSDVPADKLRRCELSREEMGDVGRAVSRLRLRQGWLIDESSGVTAEWIVRAARRDAEANRTRVVMVDYLQLLKKRDQRQSTHEHLADAVSVFADAAKADQMAYVVMSQLNRGVEQRTDKRPQLADLRESGAIEERAKLVVFLYRGAYYGPEPVRGIDYDNGSRPPDAHEFARTVQLLIAKNGNGPTGRVLAQWDGPTTKVW